MIKAINLSDISRYRSELMGLAMIFVMLFHVWMPKSNPMYGFVTLPLKEPVRYNR